MHMAGPRQTHGVTVHHAWGMTEMSLVGTTGHLKERMEALPADVVFVEELPHTTTGKIFKSKLRGSFEDYKLPTA